MAYTLEEKYELIKQKVLEQKSKNPIHIVREIMHEDYINIHGPEHHFLDGASFLVAYYNAGGEIDLKKSLSDLSTRTIKMPGAMCGYWGVCGSVTALGAALSIIHNTSMISDDEYYKDHMRYTSSVIEKMSKIGGPRCCKRNAFTALLTAVDFVFDNYGIKMEKENVVCEFTNKNNQCIKGRCLFYPYKLNR